MAWMGTEQPSTGLRIAFIAPFAFSPKATVSARMLPMAAALSRRGHRVTLIIPPYDNPADSGKHWSANGVSLVNMRLRQSPIPFSNLSPPISSTSPSPSNSRAKLARSSRTSSTSSSRLVRVH